MFGNRAFLPPPQSRGSSIICGQQAAGSSPSSRRQTGTTSSATRVSTARGGPGRPRTTALFSRPASRDFPGCIARVVSRTSPPHSAKTSRPKSYFPGPMPPLLSRRSASAAKNSRSGSRSSTTWQRETTSAPHRANPSLSRIWLTERFCPEARALRRTSSLPVQQTATLGRRETVISSTPQAAARAASAAVSRWPPGKSCSPAAHS